MNTAESDNTYIRPPVASADPQLRHATWREQSVTLGGTVGVCSRMRASTGGEGRNVSRETMRTIPNSDAGSLPTGAALSALPPLAKVSSVLAVTSGPRYLVGMVLMWWQLQGWCRPCGVLAAELNT